MKLRSPIDIFLAVTLSVFAFAFFFFRIHFGVDFFDEAFYSALCLRLHLGQTLFKDELFLASTFAPFSLPFFKLHLLLNQDLEGIILFMRKSFFAAYLLLGVLIFFSLRRVVHWTIAGVVAGSCVLFFPFNILTFSYNTLGTLFLTLALFLLWLANHQKNRILFVLSGIAIGCCSIAYITYLALAGLLFLYLLFFRRNDKGWFYLGLGLFVAYLMPFIFAINHTNDLLNALQFSKEYNYDNARFVKNFFRLRQFIPKQVFFPTCIFGGIFLWGLRHNRRILNLCVMIIPVFALVLAHLSTSYWSAYPVYICALSLLVFFAGDPSSLRTEFLTWIFIPSCVAGLISMLTSATAHLNAQVGLVPAFLTSLIFLADYMTRNHVAPRAGIIWIIGLPILFVPIYPLSIWDELPLRDLTERVQIGPYKGIFTHPEKREMAEQTYKLLKTQLSTDGPLLIYPNFSAGYLINPIRPARGVTWYQNSGRVNEILASYYREEINPNARVIRMKVYYTTPKAKGYFTVLHSDPLETLVESTHQIILDTEYFTLFAPH